MWFCTLAPRMLRGDLQLSVSWLHLFGAIMLGAAMPPFFMATTIKVDTVVQTFSWQDDQTLDPLAAVDLFVPATNTDDWVPESTAGSGSDTVEGAQAVDTVATKSTKKK